MILSMERGSRKVRLVASDFRIELLDPGCDGLTRMTSGLMSLAMIFWWGK